MFRRTRLAVPASWVVVFLVVGAAMADPSGPAAEEAKPREFNLFDGKTLDGWKITNFGGEGEVTVKDGEIRMGFGSSLTGITSSRDDLPRTNYEISFEAKRLDGSDFFAALTFPVGKGHATLINGGWGGGVFGISSIDDYDASENETTQFKEFENNKWYAFRVRVTDEKIRVWVDGKQLIDVKIKDRKIDTRIEVDRNKPLGFASWETSGAIRNIKLRELTKDEVAATNDEE